MKQPVPTEVKSDNSRRALENNPLWDIPGNPTDPDHFERSCHPSSCWSRVLTDFEYSPRTLITLYETPVPGEQKCLIYSQVICNSKSGN